MMHLVVRMLCSCPMRLITSGQTSLLLLLFLMQAVLAQAQSSYTDRRLLDIVTREAKIYQKIAEEPEFYSSDDLERHIVGLVGAYRAYLIDYPEDVNALILYGKLLRRIDQREESFAAFLKADGLDPEIAVIKQQIGAHLAESGKGKAALPFYLRAVELEPETAAYHFSLGQLLHEFRETFIEDGVFTRDRLEREMLKAFKRAAALQPDAFDLQMRLGEAYYDLARPDWRAALRRWKELRKRAKTPLRAEILDLHCARVMGKLGRQEEARSLAEAVAHPALQNSKQQALDEIALSEAEKLAEFEQIVTCEFN